MAAGTYDIRAVSAPDRGTTGNDGLVYILTGYFTSASFSGFKWRLYKITVANLLSLDPEETLSAAAGTDPALLVAVDEGELSSPTDIEPYYYSVYFWDILYETADLPQNDRLWFFRGTELLVALANAYTTPTPPVPPAPPDNAAAAVPESYKLFPVGNSRGDIGGYNVDAADLTIETVRQAEAGVSLKRGAKAVITGGNSEEGNK
jgi:hypothetical protein